MKQNVLSQKHAFHTTDMSFLKTHLVRTRQRGLLCDLDDTITVTGPRWWEELTSRFPVPEGQTMHGLLARYKRFQDVPAFQSPEAQALMVSMHMSSALHENLECTSGAVDGLGMIQRDRQRIVSYHTMRSPSVANGTRAFLRRHALPDLPILFCPDEEDDRCVEWKARAITTLWPEATGIIDDDVRIIHALPRDYLGTIYFFGHATSPRDDLHIVCVADWPHLAETLLRKSA